MVTVRFRFLVVLGAVLIAMGEAAQAAARALPPALRQVLADYRIAADDVSLYAFDLGAHAPILAHNATTPRNPASTIKLLATLAALDELGPAYTWKTQAYVATTPRDGVLESDLYLKGYGDPYFVTESFWTLLRGLRQQGLQDIRGDLVLDTSHLEPPGLDPGGFDGRPWRAYNAAPSALLMNFQAIQFRLLPDPEAKALRIVADPHPANIVIENRLRAVPGPCRGGARAVRMDVIRSARDDRVRFSGRYPLDCGDSSVYRVISEAPRYVYGLFKRLWAEQGGRFEGALREGQVPDSAIPFHAVDSRPLADIVRAINKYSNNVMTRQLVLTLGAEREGAPGTSEKGLRVLHAWLHKRGLAFPELVLENGAGLSREERISAEHLGRLLITGYTSRRIPRRSAFGDGG